VKKRLTVDPAATWSIYVGMDRIQTRIAASRMRMRKNSCEMQRAIAFVGAPHRHACEFGRALDGDISNDFRARPGAC
jgi:hypothetical protein